MPITNEFQKELRDISSKVFKKRRSYGRSFTCSIFDSDSNRFVEYWAPIVYNFLSEALGPFHVDPKPEFLPLSDGDHMAWATASFDVTTGQTRFSPMIGGKPGTLLEKMTHEFTHGNLAAFPEGDPFYEEGFVDYSVWLFSHAPIWGQYQEAMKTAAEYNIQQRQAKALAPGATDYDRKRWAGGVYAMVAKGPFLIGELKNKKIEGTRYWL